MMMNSKSFYTEHFMKTSQGTKLKGLSKNGELTVSESNTNKIHTYEKVDLLQYCNIQFIDTNKL
ncbi:hypothetical protein EMIT036CA2_11036 [Chryseobacterium sp. IT-36CA2]